MLLTRPLELKELWRWKKAQKSIDELNKNLIQKTNDLEQSQYDLSIYEQAARQLEEIKIEQEEELSEA